MTARKEESDHMLTSSSCPRRVADSLKSAAMIEAVLLGAQSGFQSAEPRNPVVWMAALMRGFRQVGICVASREASRCVQVQ